MYHPSSIQIDDSKPIMRIYDFRFQDPRGPSTGSAILDTYLQFIAENTANLQLTNEQAAKMAAKITEEQRRYAMIDDRGIEESSEPEEDEFSEEEHEPEPIKAE